MSREILFRAWIISKQKYADDVMIRFNQDSEIILLVCYDDDYFGHMDPNNVVLEQYTGLKDKNGNKIFEGDLVRVRSEKPYEIRFEKTKGYYAYSEHIYGVRKEVKQGIKATFKSSRQHPPITKTKRKRR